jgi:hypothetical protein
MHVVSPVVACSRPLSHATTICVNYGPHVRNRTYRPCQKRHDVISNGHMTASTIAFMAGQREQARRSGSEAT